VLSAIPKTVTGNLISLSPHERKFIALLRSVLRVQREIFDLVDRDFYSKFVQSDLFFRFTADPAAKSELAALEEESLLEGAI